MFVSIELPNSVADDISYGPIVCKMGYVNVSILSHALLASNDCVCHSFEKQTIAIGS